MITDNIIKLEFKKNNLQLSQESEIERISIKKFTINTYNNLVKISGKSNNQCFFTKLKFIINNEKISEIYITDITNIDNYTLTLQTCTAPAAGAATYLTRGYEWCTRMSDELGDAGKPGCNACRCSTGSQQQVAQMIFDTLHS
jgi:hypothetical protein